MAAAFPLAHHYRAVLAGVLKLPGFEASMVLRDRDAKISRKKYFIKETCVIMPSIIRSGIQENEL